VSIRCPEVAIARTTCRCSSESGPPRSRTALLSCGSDSTPAARALLSLLDQPLFRAQQLERREPPLEPGRNRRHLGIHEYLVGELQHPPRRCALAAGLGNGGNNIARVEAVPSRG
jgi:hypothetical protein